MEKSKESKEIFKIHIDGPDVDSINENLGGHEIGGFYIIAFADDGVCVTGRNIDRAKLSATIAHDENLRKAACAAIIVTAFCKGDKEDEDGKEN